MTQSIRNLDKRYGIFRAVKFGIAGILGFLVAEAILTLGVLVLYGSISVPSAESFSGSLLVLNVIAFAIGVTLAFFVNEVVTV